MPPGPWRLDARPSLPARRPRMASSRWWGRNGGSVVEGFGVPSGADRAAGGDPTFGAVTQEARSVELRSDGIVEPARTVPLPPSLVRLRPVLRVARGRRARATPSPSGPTDQPSAGSYVVPPIDVTHDGNYVLARFDAFGEAWELSAPRSGDGCSLRQIPHLFGGGGTCEVVIASSRGPQGHAFAYGTLPAGADTAQVVAADGSERIHVRVLTTRRIRSALLRHRPRRRRSGRAPVPGRRWRGRSERYRDMTWRDRHSVAPLTLVRPD